MYEEYAHWLHVAFKGLRKLANKLEPLHEIAHINMGDVPVYMEGEFIGRFVNDGGCWTFEEPNRAPVNEARLRSTTSAVVWAQEFNKVCPEVDPGLMVGWFANAIEAGRAAK